MIGNEPIVLAAIDALTEIPGNTITYPASTAMTVIEAVRPFLAEQIALAIEASRNSRSYFYADELGNAQFEADTAAREDAARIARETV